MGELKKTVNAMYDVVSIGVVAPNAAITPNAEITPKKNDVPAKRRVQVTISFLKLVLDIGQLPTFFSPFLSNYPYDFGLLKRELNVFAVVRLMDTATNASRLEIDVHYFV